MLLSLLIPRKLVTMRESLIKPLMFNFLGRRESCFQFTESQTHPPPPNPAACRSADFGLKCAGRGLGVELRRAVC